MKRMQVAFHHIDWWLWGVNSAFIHPILSSPPQWDFPEDQWHYRIVWSCTTHHFLREGPETEGLNWCGSPDTNAFDESSMDKDNLPQKDRAGDLCLQSMLEMPSAKYCYAHAISLLKTSFLHACRGRGCSPLFWWRHWGVGSGLSTLNLCDSADGYLSGVRLPAFWQQTNFACLAEAIRRLNHPAEQTFR